MGVDLIITGWVDNPLEYMNRFDVGCLLSRWEGFGLVIPEYMLTRTPIVATRVDAIPYLITDGVDGLLVDKDDWENVAKMICMIEADADKKNTLINNAIETVSRRFDVRRVSKQIEALYESM